MRASRAFAVAATACVAAVGLSAPQAVATTTGGNHGPTDIRLFPNAVHPGSTLTVLVRGCVRSGRVTSNAFPTANLSPLRGRAGAFGDRFDDRFDDRRFDDRRFGDRDFPDRGFGDDGDDRVNGDTLQGDLVQGDATTADDGKALTRKAEPGKTSTGKTGTGTADDGKGGEGGEGFGGDRGFFPDRGFLGDRGRFDGPVSIATARIYNHAVPGRYRLAVRCDRSNRIAVRSFRVLSARGAQGGLGGSMAPSDKEMAMGGGLVATAAVGGAAFIVRRRRLNGGEV
ncbi:hypothetical protein [Streptomyces sp. NPDC000410]|uniref:hypothetical protein n=1 Tax=Streptomyces sp. NPDC000410 TaxID=3154254 RepID=UPI0033257153